MNIKKTLQNILKLPKTLVAGVLTMIVGLVLISPSLNPFATEETNVTVGFNSSKAETWAGDEVELKVIVENHSDARINNVYAQQQISDQVNYIPGSSYIDFEGQSYPVDDNWMVGGANLGGLDPDKNKYLRFKVKIDEDVQNGTVIGNDMFVRWDEHPSQIPRRASITIVPRDQNGAFKPDFLRVINVTNSTPRATEVDVIPGNVIEYFVWIENTGAHPIRNAKLFANWTSNPMPVLTPSVTLSADNAAMLQDTVTVRGNMPIWLTYYPGHAMIYGNTGLYNCPNGCPLHESFYVSPMPIGDIQPGTSQVIQLKFKNAVNGSTPTPTPSPTPSPTPTPTVTPSPSPQVYSCNSVCIPLANDSNQDVCSKALGSNYACIKTTTNPNERNQYRCRLKSNPTSAQCVAPSPSPSVTPKPSPKVYSCNSICAPAFTNQYGNPDPCTKALGNDYACTKITANDTSRPEYRCRLKKAPNSAQCTVSTPTPSPSVSPTPSPSPSPAPGTTGFVISKFEDVDGDGGRDTGEKGLTWEFEWEKNNDGNWKQYVTDANNDGYGETMKGFNDNDTIKIREKGRDSWKATTPTEVSLTLRKDHVMHARFGNQPQKPSVVTNTPNPTQLPATGSESVGVITMAIGTFLTGLGLKKKYTA